jgi:mannose-6-phosphate isomerase-like protein (cupin superfamily)
MASKQQAVDANEVLGAWSERGFHGGVWVDPPGQVWRNFVHENDELLMLVEGQLELEIAGRSFTPAVGEEIVIPAGAMHTVRNLGATTARWLYAYKRS